MKDLNFLKSNVIAYHGIYDNERIFENTLQSYARAKRYEYAIQLDIKMLGCGTLVCFHDDNLERMLHVDQDLSGITYDELNYIAKYQIPTLQEVLEAIDGSVPLIFKLEGKSRKNMFEKKVSEALDSYNGNFALISDNKKILKWFNKNKPEYIIGYIVNSSNYLKFLLFKKYDFLTIDVRLIADNNIKKLRESRLVIGYLIKTESEYEAKKYIYDNLVLDNVLEIIKGI